MASPSTSIPAKGFTLVELLLVLALVSLLFALGLTVSFESYRTAINRSDRDTIAALLAHARSSAIANIDHAPWGLCYNAPNYVVFEGTDCSAATYKETTQATNGVTVTGLTTSIVFAQLSGTTSAATLSTPATITVTEQGRSSTITVNYEGTIQ